MLNEQWEDRDELVFGELKCQQFALGDVPHLIAESVEEFDRVDSEDRMDGALSRLQIGKYVASEKVDDIDEDIGRCDTELRSSVAALSDGLTCCVDPRDAIEVRR